MDMQLHLESKFITDINRCLSLTRPFIGFSYTMAGYLLTKRHLNVDDLNTLKVRTSIAPLCGSNLNECIRGQSSFGTKLEQKGLGVVYPSFANPKPGNLTFFEGGYITSNYISQINAMQFELPPSISSTRNRTNFAKKFAEVIVEYMTERNILRSFPAA